MDEPLPLRSSDDLGALRREVAIAAAQLGLRTIERTRLLTAASELARNAVVHGGGGHATIEVLREGMRTGVRLVVEDDGPGIPDLEQAFTDGWSSAGGLGLGLGGTRRLVSDLRVDSTPGEGTRVTATMWR